MFRHPIYNFVVGKPVKVEPSVPGGVDSDPAGAVNLAAASSLGPGSERVDGGEGSVSSVSPSSSTAEAAPAELGEGLPEPSLSAALEAGRLAAEESMRAELGPQLVNAFIQGCLGEKAERVLGRLNAEAFLDVDGSVKYSELKEFLSAWEGDRPGKVDPALLNGKRLSKPSGIEVGRGWARSGSN